jgi:hypothetical protein
MSQDEDDTDGSEEELIGHIALLDALSVQCQGLAACLSGAGARHLQPANDEPMPGTFNECQAANSKVPPTFATGDR